MKKQGGGVNFYYYYLKLREFFTRKPVIEHFGYETNTKCTLRCKECHSYIPYYKNYYTTDIDSFKMYVDKILKSVDFILSFRLQGGETLLVKDLPEMVKYAVKQKQIQHMQIISNGTMMPSKELLEAMKNPKVTFILSDYSCNEDIKPILKYEEILKTCKENGVNAVQIVTTPYVKWFARNAIRPKSEPLDKERALKSLKSCYCFSTPKVLMFFNGKFHICPVSAYYEANMPEFEFPQDEVIDVMKTPSKILTQKIKDMVYKKYYSLCSRCNAGDNADVRTLPGEQIKS